MHRITAAQSPVPIADLLWETAARHGDRIAVYERERRTSYASLAERAGRLANGIAARAAPGDRVFLLIENSADFFAALWGALAAGAIAIPFVASSGTAEIAHALALTTPGLAVVTERTARTFAAAGSAVAIATVAALADGQPATRPQIRLGGADDPALLIFSSGTTGLPKGIVHTSRTLRWRCQAAWVAGRDWPDDIACCATPLASRLMRIVPTLWLGGSFSLAEGTGVATVLGTLARDRARTLWGVPTLLHMLLLRGRREAHDLAHWQRVLSFSAHLHPTIQRNFAEQFRVPVYPVYGMLEAGVAAEAIPGTPLGSVGRGNHGVTIEIIGPDGAVLGPDVDGDIRYRGPIVMAGYWDDPTATSEALQGGNLHTGDIGRFDRDGNLYIVGRAKEIIKRNGVSVSPALVEDVLLGHPAIAEAVVVGRPDARRGEQVIAVVTLRDGCRADPTDLLRYLRGKLAGAYLPNAIEIRPTLPKAPSGKIIRRALFTVPDPPDTTGR